MVLDVKRDEEITYNLVTTEEADAANGKISTTSPIGRALLGKEPGGEALKRTVGRSVGIHERERRPDTNSCPRLCRTSSDASGMSSPGRLWGRRLSTKPNRR